MTWLELRRMYRQLDRLRLAMGCLDPKVGSPAREEVERLAMHLEAALDEGVNEACVQMLQQSLKRRQLGCS